MFDLERISLREIITISFTLFAVIDMLGSAPILITLKNKVRPEEFKPSQATIVSGLLMIIFLFAGKPFLNLLGLDVESFAVAGSIVIFILGLEMVLNIEFFRHDGGGSSGNIVPIAFPLIAGSGTLTTVMSLKANFYDGNILIGIFINLIIVFLVLHSLKWIEKALGPGGLMVMRKFFGVVLLAIAIKIFTSNAAGFFK